MNFSVRKLRSLNANEQVARIIRVRDLAGSCLATGDVVAVVVRKTAVVGFKQAVTGLHAGGKARGLQQVARPIVLEFVGGGVREAHLGQAVGVIVLEGDRVTEGVVAANTLPLASSRRLAARGKCGSYHAAA